jgi:quercetin dioxygenase-like cupin family protein
MSIHTLTETYKITAGTGLSDVWWKGGRMAIKATGAETGGGFTQIETTDPHGAATPMHVHRNEDESFYVLEGEVRLIVDGERIDLCVGDYAFAPRGTTHGYVVVSERARMLTTLTPAGLEELFIALGEPVTGDEPPSPDRSPSIDEVARKFGAYGCEVVGPPPTFGDLS